MALTLNLLGPARLLRDGQELPLPPSRKTRALLCYLVLSGTARRREELCSLFWDVPDDPRGALRWSLSKLRPLLEVDGESLLEADRDTVLIRSDAIVTDAQTLRLYAADPATPEADADAIWQAAQAPFMADCDLPNQPEFSLWLERERAAAPRIRAALARQRATSAGASQQRREKWGERWLQDAPYDRDAARHQVATLHEAGHVAEAETLAQRITAQFREAELAPPDFTAKTLCSVDGELEEEALPKQAIRFVRAGDGISLAWATSGAEDAPPLVKAANWLNHLELDWDAPIWSPLFRDLSKSHRLIRYDERGCGLSDWNVDSIDFESFVTDLEMVVDAAGLERFPLLGISQGAAVSIEYAARHPDRVSHLILFGGYPVGWRPIASPQETREREAVMVLTESGWGRDNPAYRHMFSSTFMPSATSQELEWFDEFQRNTTSPANAVRFLEAFSTIDVRHRLAEVQCPTLVVHSLQDKRIPVATGRSLAAQIHNAEFLGLDSPNHLLLGREPAAQVMLDAIREFLAK